MLTADVLAFMVITALMLVTGGAAGRAAASAATAVPVAARRLLGRAAAALVAAPPVAIVIAGSVIVTGGGAPTELRVAHALFVTGAWSLAGLAALATAAGIAAGRARPAAAIVVVGAGAIAALVTPLPLFARLDPAAVATAPFVGLACTVIAIVSAMSMLRRLPGRSAAGRRHRLLTGAMLALVLVPGGAAAVESARGTAESGRHPAPGTMHVVDGIEMHVLCTGSGSPTVLLDAGHGGDSTAWSWVQRSLEGTMRVCSYDRPGYGWSAYAAVERGPRASAERALALLQAAGESGPFVVVGHSLGAHVARAFAAASPELTLALVLVDPRHEDIPSLVEGYEESVRSTVGMLRVGVALAPLGALRLVGDTSGELDELPADVQAAAVTRLARTDHVRASRDELVTMDAADEAMRTLPDLGATPLLVVSAGSPMAGFTDDLWQQLGPLHEDLAGRSRESRRVTIDGADHVSLLTREPYAAQVAAAVEAFVASVTQRDADGVGMGSGH